MKLIKLAAFAAIVLFTGCFNNNSGKGTTNPPVNPPTTYGYFRALQPKLSASAASKSSDFSVAAATNNPSVTMSTPRSGHKAIEISNGLYMLIGGEMDNSINNPSTLPSVIDLFDINTETFTRQDTITNVSRHWKSDGTESFSLVKIPNNRILMIGGAQGINETVEIYFSDLKISSLYTDVFPSDLPVNNVGHAFYIGKNKVLLVGCWYSKDNQVTPRDNAIIDIITMKASFISTPVFLYRNTAVQLSDKSVIYAGGEDNNYTSHNDIYKIGTDLVTTKIGTMNVARQDYAMTLLSDGKIGIYGGVNRPSASGVNVYHKSVEVLNPTTGTTSLSVNLLAERLETLAIPLQNGFVLNAGGCDGNGRLVSSEFVHNHITQISGTTGDLNVARRFYSAIQLNNGKVLISGGDNTGTAYNTAEIYDPAMKLIVSYDTSNVVSINSTIHFAATETCTWSVTAIDPKLEAGTIGSDGTYIAPATATKVRIIGTGLSNSATVIIEVVE